jgi:hypothetical protein
MSEIRITWARRLNRPHLPVRLHIGKGLAGLGHNKENLSAVELEHKVFPFADYG